MFSLVALYDRDGKQMHLKMHLSTLSLPLLLNYKLSVKFSGNYTNYTNFGQYNLTNFIRQIFIYVSRN